MPGAVGSGAEWKEFTSWISGKEDLDTALKNIDAAWPSSGARRPATERPSPTLGRGPDVLGPGLEIPERSDTDHRVDLGGTLVTENRSGGRTTGARALWALAIAGRLIISILVPLVAFVDPVAGLPVPAPDNDAPKVGRRGDRRSSGASAASRRSTGSMNWFLARLPERVGSRSCRICSSGRRIAILIWFLALPTIRTLWISLFNADSSTFVGLGNYTSIFGNPAMLEVFRNNLLWLVVGTTLVRRARPGDRGPGRPQPVRVAGQGDHLHADGDLVRRRGHHLELRLRCREAGEPQIGLLNAIVTALGGEPQAWTTLLQPWNNLFLIVIMVWLQIGFAMVLFSAAIKGIPAELHRGRAGRRRDRAPDLLPGHRSRRSGARSSRWRRRSIILTLKIFDVVIVMTGGQFGPA